ncbi:hypothetical protein TRVL_05578 [Trypanosoma vivax]|nr:hypothetical protein TRVL_05578 [Trypanosoma vivax]
MAFATLHVKSPPRLFAPISTLLATLFGFSSRAGLSLPSPSSKNRFAVFFFVRFPRPGSVCVFVRVAFALIRRRNSGAFFGPHLGYSLGPVDAGTVVRLDNWLT